jgi:hypothetical protein
MVVETAALLEKMALSIQVVELGVAQQEAAATVVLELLS